jgi:hypothetical protein
MIPGSGKRDSLTRPSEVLLRKLRLRGLCIGEMTGITRQGEGKWKTRKGRLFLFFRKYNQICYGTGQAVPFPHFPARTIQSADGEDCGRLGTETGLGGAGGQTFAQRLERGRGSVSQWVLCHMRKTCRGGMLSTEPSTP